MSKPSPPPTPDYRGAAVAQGAANLDAARATAKLSNPSFSNPLGTRSVTYGAQIPASGGRFVGSGETRDFIPNPTNDPDRVFVEDKLTPQGQRLFDTNMQTQMGLGSLANQGIGQVQGALGQPFNFQGPQQASSLSQGVFGGGPGPTTTGAPNLQQYTQNTNRAPGATTSQYGSIDPTTSAQALNPSGGQIQSGLGDAGQINRGFADVGNNQRNLDFSGAPQLPQASFSGQNDPVTQAIMQRNQPFMDRRREQMRTQLINEGHVQGNEAYGNAMQDLGRQENDFNLAAIQAGAQQQNQMFGQQLAARQQGVGEAGQQGAFANTAQGQAFQQAAMRGEFGNEAQQQAFAQQLAGGTFSNQAQQQRYQQEFGNAGLNLGAQQQAFGQMVGADQQALGRQQQAYQQQLAGAGLDLGAEQQAYGQNLGVANLGLGAQQQQFGQQLQGTQMSNQAEQARLAQEQQAAQFQNQARQQQFAEQSYLRDLPLNEVTALMSGSQVQMPQFQGYTGAQVQPAPMFGATQAAGQYAGDLYNSKVGQQNALMQGLFGLGGAAVMGGGIPGIPGIGRGL